MQIKRRDFLKATAAAGAVAALGGIKLNAFADSGETVTGGTDAGNWIPSTCQGCTQWCPIEIFVQSNRAVKVRGNQLSKVNNGYVCPRGHLILQELYDPDRVKVPMVRTNAAKGRGVDPGFVATTWDAAITTIAARIKTLIDNNVAHKFVLLRGRYGSKTADLAYGTLPKIIGSPNNISHSALCAEAEKFGPLYAEGKWAYRDYDLANTKCLVAWGCDPLSSNRNIPNTINKIGGILERGGKVITIDPRLTSIGAKSHEWIPIKPGEDSALAVAIAHYALTQGLWSKDFVGNFNDGKNQFVAGQLVDEAAFTEKYTFGLVKWWNLELKDRTPEWAADKCGVTAAQIKSLTRTMAAAGPALSLWMGPGVAMSPRGAYASFAVYALVGLFGCSDTQGGTLMHHKSVNTTALPGFPTGMARTAANSKKIDQRGRLGLPAIGEKGYHSQVITNNVATGINTEDPYPIEMVLSYWSNFNFSCTGASRWDDAMSRTNSDMSKVFYVHIGTNPSESAMFADIVLPAKHHATQKLAVIDNKGNLYSHISIQQPVVAPLWEEKADETEIMFLIAKKLATMGFPNMLNYYKQFPGVDDTTTPEQFAEKACQYIAGTNWSALTTDGLVNSAVYSFKAKWGNYATIADGDGKGAKKFQFYSNQLKKDLGDHASHLTPVVTIDEAVAAAGYLATGDRVFVPHYEEPKQFGDAATYPFIFVDFKSRLNREGRSQNAPWYHEFKKADAGDESGEDIVRINPVDGAALGIATGDMVKLTSTFGAITVKAKLWEGVRPGTVSKCYGQGHWAYGKVAAKVFGSTARGANNNDLMPFDIERFTGANCRNGGFTRVKVEKV